MQVWLRVNPTLTLITFLGIAAVGSSETTIGQPPTTNLKSDEEILFFPTYGRLDDQAGVWRFDVHGKVYEPENSSRKRAALLALLRTSVDVGNQAFLEERIRPFLVDNEGGKTVTIEIAGQRMSAGESESNGHFSQSVSVSVDSLAGHASPRQVQSFKAVLRPDDERVFLGRAHLIADNGLSVVSDIDDTIKHSQVTDKKQLVQNTFVRPFRAIDGMPELYAELAHSSVAFHYVSSSPWQLYQPLSKFMSLEGFPDGTMHLRLFRLKDASGLRFLQSQKSDKPATIQALLAAFPNRRFLLVGDSGERDPEIYGEIARQHPEQVAAIFIRNVTGEPRDSGRYSIAFAELPKDRCVVFEEVAQIRGQMSELAQQP